MAPAPATTVSLSWRRCSARPSPHAKCFCISCRAMRATARRCSATTFTHGRFSASSPRSRRAPRCCKDCRHDLLCVIDNGEAHLEPRADEGIGLHVREEREERVPEAVDVGDDDGLCVPAELHPGELLDELLERADAAGERYERVR